MSERRKWFAFLLLLAAAVPCGAQQPGDAEAQRARIDSLSAQFLAAEAALDSATEAARREHMRTAVARLDTQRVGFVTVVSTPGDAEVARVATERALRRLGELGRDPRSPLASLTLLVQEGVRTAGFPAADSGAIPVWLPSYTIADRRTEALAHALGTRLAERLPEDVRRWLGTSAAATIDDAQLERVYRALLLTRSASARACHEGDLGACARALGFATGDSLPLDVHARQSLLAYALERGGLVGFARLERPSDAPLLERIASAAGETPDALLAGWRQRMIAARPAQSAGLAVSGLATLFWIGIVSVFAVRSTRWRLG